MKTKLLLSLALASALFAGNAFGISVGRTNVKNETGADLWISFNKVTYSCMGGFAGITKFPSEKYCTFDLIEKGKDRSPGSSATGAKAVIYAYVCQGGQVVRKEKNYETQTDEIVVSLNSSGEIEVEEKGTKLSVKVELTPTTGAKGKK